MIVTRGLGVGGDGAIVAFGLTRGSLIIEVAKRFLTVVLEIRN